MGAKAKRGKKTKRASRPKKRAGKKRAPRARGQKSQDLINAGMHDFTNLATAVRAYLELLSTQGVLDEKQAYYVARAREQVEMMVDLVHELKDKLI